MFQISEEIKEVLNQTRKTDNKNRPISNSHHLSAQTVFSVLDYLVKWKRFQAQKAPVSYPGKGKLLWSKLSSDYLLLWSTHQLFRER